MAELQKYPQLALVLRQLREANHYCQEDIAAVIDVNRKTYSNYEAGIRQPDAKQIKQLADFYRIPYAEMLARLCHPAPAAPSHQAPHSLAEQYAEEYRIKILNPRKFWNELFSLENIRLVFYFTKVEPLGQREISEFIQKDAEGFYQV